MTRMCSCRGRNEAGARTESRGKNEERKNRIREKRGNAHIASRGKQIGNPEEGKREEEGAEVRRLVRSGNGGREKKRVGETVRQCGCEIFIWHTEQERQPKFIQRVHVFLGLPAEQTAHRANTAP